MNEPFRTESDSMGPMQIPASAYYGAQTARAVENFPISNLRFPRSFIRALGLIKKHAALTNQELGGLKPHTGRRHRPGRPGGRRGKWDGEFVLDIFQTGSGTSTNMNANEVIANRAIELLGGKRGEKLVHPNDHVNRGQSSNDVIPTAIHLAALEAMERRLHPGPGRFAGGACSARRRNFTTSSKLAAPICRTPRPSGSARNSAATPAKSSMAWPACAPPRRIWANWPWAAPPSARASTPIPNLPAAPSPGSPRK